MSGMRLACGVSAYLAYLAGSFSFGFTGFGGWDFDPRWINGALAAGFFSVTMFNLIAMAAAGGAEGLTRWITGRRS